MTKRPGRVLLAIAGLVLAVRCASAFDNRIEINGACLRLKERPELYTTNPFANAGSPFFLAPFDMLTPGSGDAPDRKGLSVRLWKHDAAHRDLAVNRRLRGGMGQCLEKPMPHGLVLEVRDPDLADRRRYGHRCPSSYGVNRYTPAEKTFDYGAITIICSTLTSKTSCQMTHPLESGWELRMFLPREELPRWREAADAAEEFFLATFEDCPS